MFDFGFWELTIVLVVALLVVGPDKLPIVAAKAGRWVGKLKRMVQTVRSDIESEIKAVELKEMLQKQQSEISELRSIINEAQTDIEQDISSMEQEISSLTKDNEDLLPDSIKHQSEKSSAQQDESSSKPKQSI